MYYLNIKETSDLLFQDEEMPIVAGAASLVTIQPPPPPVIPGDLPFPTGNNLTTAITLGLLNKTQQFI